MTDNNKKNNDFQKLLEKDNFKIPQIGDIIEGIVLSSSKAEVKLDIDGIYTGVVRGRELYFESDEYANLKPGDTVEATVIDAENENGELELSFRSAGQQKAWSVLIDSFNDKKIIKVKINDANKGGLLVSYAQIQGFLPVSQLAPENYPRINGGDKGKILEKLKSFVGSDFEVKIITLDEKEEKLVVSEKEAWQEKQKHIISQYKVGSVVDGKITAITDFGVFISFGENLEGLIHISELAWQRIDDLGDLYKIGDKIQAEIISFDGSKIFLSAKKLLSDPWQEVEKKYSINQTVSGLIIKVNPFGLFVELDRDIHGLAHISHLGLAHGRKISDIYKVGEKKEFKIISIEAKDHRLGLSPLKPNPEENAREDKSESDDRKESSGKKHKEPAKIAVEPAQEKNDLADERPKTIKKVKKAKTVKSKK